MLDALAMEGREGREAWAHDMAGVRVQLQQRQSNS